MILLFDERLEVGGGVGWCTVVSGGYTLRFLYNITIYVLTYAHDSVS